MSLFKEILIILITSKEIHINKNQKRLSRKNRKIFFQILVIRMMEMKINIVSNILIKKLNTWLQKQPVKLRNTFNKLFAQDVL